MNIYVCVGSSCHLKGSKEIIDKLNSLIEESGLKDTVVLKGSFCMGKCGERGVSVKVNDEVYSIEEKDVKYFFQSQILPLAKDK